VHTLLGWKEIKIAAIYDVEAKPLDSQSGRWVDRPKTTTYITTLASAEGFGRWLEVLNRPLGSSSWEMVPLGYGTLRAEPSGRSLVQTHFPDAVQIPDWYHLSEHVLAGHAWEASHILYGESSGESEQ